MLPSTCLWCTPLPFSTCDHCLLIIEVYDPRTRTNCSRLAQICFFSSYDPGYVNTACCKSAICDIDGQKGLLAFRGYSIEELVEKSTFLEVAFLVIFGSLPDAVQLDQWTRNIMRHSFLHNNLAGIMSQFRYDAHPCGMMISAVSALGTFFPEANPALKGADIFTRQPQIRDRQLYRILGKLPTIAAQSYRNRLGRPFNTPMSVQDPTPLTYTENFIYMLDRLSEQAYRPNPKLVRALDRIWILHAEHGMSSSTATLRQLVSTGVDPYSAIVGAIASLYGNRHGGANEAVLKMLTRIGSVDAVSKYLTKVKKEKRVLFGFGHRVYKAPDPRAILMKRIAQEVFEICGTPPLWSIALELEKQVLLDEDFLSRKLYPNIDYYSGIVYQALGFPSDMFPVLFAIPLSAGWLAHWMEHLQTVPLNDNNVFSPKHIYIGKQDQTYTPIEQRSKEENSKTMSPSWTKSGFSSRRDLGTNYDTKHSSPELSNSQTRAKL